MTHDGPVLLSGGTGLIGSRLCSGLLRGGAGVRVLTRSSGNVAPRVDGRLVGIRWDGTAPPEGALAESSAVVHLAGEPVFSGRLNPARRRRIRDSRVLSTQEIVRGIGALPSALRPHTLVCASAVGYYGDRGDEVLDEAAPAGRGFLADVCREWEVAAANAEALGIRVVRLRIGIVLSRSGGALARMLLPFRFGLGGRLGSGRQWFPWIHIDDVVALIERVLYDEEFSGAVNATAPNPVRNDEFTRTLGRLLNRPTFMTVPGALLQTALGELADELLGSRRVVPARAQAEAFAFRYPNIESALVSEI
jgi:uncharacterized protein (TIGR01777 family)